jgi:hypothetical protein
MGACWEVDIPSRLFPLKCVHDFSWAFMVTLINDKAIRMSLKNADLIIFLVLIEISLNINIKFFKICGVFCI